MDYTVEPLLCSVRDSIVQSESLLSPQGYMINHFPFRKNTFLSETIRIYGPFQRVLIPVFQYQPDVQRSTPSIRVSTDKACSLSTTRRYLPPASSAPMHLIFRTHVHVLPLPPKSSTSYIYKPFQQLPTR